MRIEIDRNYCDINIIACDDDSGVLDGIRVQMKRLGLKLVTTTDPERLIAILQSESFDILVLDYFFIDTDAEQIVRRIREFDKLIYIIILTGHTSINNPYQVLANLNVQNYCEKSDKYDAFVLQVLSAANVINQRKNFNHTEFGVALSELRKERGLSKTELGNVLKVSRKTISEWEKGYYLPGSEMLVQLCHILNTTPNILLGIS